MSEAERTGLDHVVLPRRLPGLALLERYLPAAGRQPARRRARRVRGAGDTVLDPWAGTGWTARRAIAARHAGRVRRSEPVRPARRPWPSCRRPDPAVLDAAFAQLVRLAAGRRAAATSTSRSCTPRAAHLPPPRGRRAVHLAPRRGCARTQDLPLRQLRRCPSAAPRSGRRRSTRSTSPSSASSAATTPDGSDASGRTTLPDRRPAARARAA